uniref:Ribonuclease toxin, BrnT, of type II toxin-antitoxin system n=1 Tax=Candidatus Kentrum sp. DK TaxID=2126562 RepID=A0A450S0B3_9GAMM|nr:MAG: Ribonuclease toxin, BrnT, of type II toxin-antitoxin system [Candidatus Kentron sp. DK]
MDVVAANTGTKIFFSSLRISASLSASAVTKEKIATAEAQSTQRFAEKKRNQRVNRNTRQHSDLVVALATLSIPWTLSSSLVLDPTRTFARLCQLLRRNCITVVDAEHSRDEERYLSIGLSRNGRLLLLAHTDRAGRIRIISARKATKREERFYEYAQ